MKLFLFLVPLVALCQPPDSGFNIQLNSSQTSTSPFNNQIIGCTAWQITYTSTGFTGLSLLAQVSPAGPLPTSWTPFAGQVQLGANPNTSTTGAITWLQNQTTVVSWFQLQLSGFSGSNGSISGTVYCWRSNQGPGGTGGGTVTNVSSGNFTPLFNVLVSSPTTTPSFGFTPISQVANTFYASPNGSTGNPTFRAIVSTDIPTLNQNTSGQSATTLAFASLPVPCSAGNAPLGILANGNSTGCQPVGTGTVTTFSAGNLSPLFTTNVSTATSTPALSFALVSQSQNLIYSSPNGLSGVPGFRSLVGADLPNPSSSTLGGIQSLAVVSHKWINTISTSGVPTATQPACADLSDSTAFCNMTNTAGGDLSGTYPNPTVNGIKSVPFCSGFTPTNTQFLQYTTGGSPNPCYSAAAASGATAATPYIVIGGTSYVQWDLATATKPSAPTWINSVTPSASGAGTNGDYIISNVNGSTIVAFGSYTASASIEGDFSIASTGGSTGGLGGIWLLDSTNNNLYVLALFTQATTGACILATYKFTYNGTGNPAFSSNTNMGGSGNLAHLKISVSAGTLTYAISANGGANFTTMTTVGSIGTITKGGVFLDGDVMMDIFSLLIT